MDFEKMAQNIEAERAEHDKRTADALNKLSEEHTAKQLQWNTELYHSIADDKNNREAMEKEIAEVQAEADKRIKQIKDRYSARYGKKDWNSDINESFRDFAGNLIKNR